MNFIFKKLMMFTLFIVAGWTIAEAQTTPAQRIGLTLEDNRSVYTTVGERNQYENDLRLSQPNGNYKLTAGLLNAGNNHIVFHRVDQENTDSAFARINLNAVKTVPESEVIDMLDFYQDGAGAHSGSTTITQAMLGDGNWGTDGTNLVWQASGYAYITNTTGFTFTVPAGYSDASLEFIIYNGTNVRGGYWAYNLNSEGWSIAATASAGGVSSFVITGLDSGDVISFLGAGVSNNQYQLYQSPDIELIGVIYLPNSYLPTIDVTPSISYWSNGAWGAESPLGNSVTYNPNDTIDLYGLGTVTDAFFAETKQNAHSSYYNYKVTLDGNIIMPSGSATGLDFYSSADFSACTTSDPTSASMTGYNGWSFNSAAAYSSSGIISMYIQYYGAIVFTMPDNFMGNSVNVTVTSSAGSDGAGILYVNGVLHTFTSGSTYTWTVPVSANGTIEFKSDGQTYSVDITRIVISSGNGSALNAPMHVGTIQTDKPGLKKVAPKPIGESKKERYNNVKINE